VVFQAPGSQRVDFLFQVKSIFRDDALENPDSFLEQVDLGQCFFKFLIIFRFFIALYQVRSYDAGEHNYANE
jgi:hypothetical protein